MTVLTADPPRILGGLAVLEPLDDPRDGVAPLEAVPPVPAPRPQSRLAHPDSPVGRTAAAPSTPLSRLAARLGRPLLDLGTCTDTELHALTGLLLGETHKRAARWLPDTP